MAIASPPGFYFGRGHGDWYTEHPATSTLGAPVIFVNSFSRPSTNARPETGRILPTGAIQFPRPSIPFSSTFSTSRTTTAAVAHSTTATSSPVPTGHSGTDSNAATSASTSSRTAAIVASSVAGGALIITVALLLAWRLLRRGPRGNTGHTSRLGGHAGIARQPTLLVLGEKNALGHRISELPTTAEVGALAWAAASMGSRDHDAVLQDMARDRQVRRESGFNWESASQLRWSRLTSSAPSSRPASRTSRPASRISNPASVSPASSVAGKRDPMQSPGAGRHGSARSVLRDLMRRLPSRLQDRDQDGLRLNPIATPPPIHWP